MIFFTCTPLYLSLFPPQPLPFPHSCLSEPAMTGLPLKVVLAPTSVPITVPLVNGLALDAPTTTTTHMIVDASLAQILTMHRSTPPFCKCCHLENNRVKGVSTWTLRGPAEIPANRSVQLVTLSLHHSLGLLRDTKKCKSSHFI